jgi:hypothetical protein
MKTEDRQLCRALSQVGNCREHYVMRRLLTAFDRVIASQSNEQLQRAVKWTTLWHEQFKSGLL